MSEPVTYSVDRERALVETTISEGATYQDIAVAFAALRADPQIGPSFNRMAIYEAATVNLTSAEVREMVEAAAHVPHSPNTRIAVVVRCDLMFGMMRMYEVYAETLGIHVQVFRDRTEAEQWLTRLRR